MRKIKFLQRISIVIIAIFAAGSVFEAKAIPGESDRTFAASSLYSDAIPRAPAPFFERTGFSDGKLLADGSLISFGTFIGADAGGYGGNVYDFYLQKLRPNGTLDTSFGTNGTKRIHLWEGRSYGAAIKIQPDNKIVIAGYCFIAANFGTPQEHVSGFGICAMRLLPNGSLDGSFGGNAVSVPELSFNYNMPAGTVFFASNQVGSEGQGTSGANTVDIAPNGDIILAGLSHFQNDPAFPNTASNYATVVRLNSGGAFLNITRVSDPFDLTAGTRTNRAREFNAIAVQSDGKVLAVGESQVFSDESKRLFAVRISTTGSVEKSFVGESIVGNTAALSITFTRSNKFVVAGGRGNTPLMYRFNSDFTLDPTFGNGGKIAYCYNGQPVCSDRYTSYDQQGYIKIGAIQPDGKMVALMGNFGPGLSYTYFARFNPDGSYDRSLGTTVDQGISIYNYGSVYSYPYINNQFVGYIPNFLVVRPNGRIVSGGQEPVGNGGLYQAAVTQLMGTPKNGIYSDFNNDGKGEIAVFRPSDGVWYQTDSFTKAFVPAQWGIGTDKLAPADYDGDGRTDLAVFRNGVWYILQSSNGQIRYENFGAAGDVPVPGDFNSDGQADVAVFRPSNGNWYIHYSNPIQPGDVNFLSIHFGQSGDIPVLGDFDGDGRTDITVFRGGDWYQLLSATDLSFKYTHFGLAGDVPVTGDYDGDGKTDIAVFRNGIWYALTSSDGGVRATQWGIASDKPVPADYDNDGKTDLGVYRAGIWYILKSSDNTYSATNFGLASDTPIPSVYQH